MIENFKVGGLSKYGLSYKDIQQINPKIIYCSITGFGQNGPLAENAGYDFLIQVKEGEKRREGREKREGERGERRDNTYLYMFIPQTKIN